MTGFQMNLVEKAIHILSCWVNGITVVDNVLLRLSRNSWAVINTFTLTIEFKMYFSM
jgi:hypothetical protein